MCSFIEFENYLTADRQIHLPVDLFEMGGLRFWLMNHVMTPAWTLGY